MKPPPLLIGVTVLFWGSQTDFLFVAILIALLLEGARFIQWRWQLHQLEFNRTADLSAVFMVGLAIFFFLGEQDTLAIFKVLQWLPICLLPLMVAERYSVQQLTPLSSLFYRLRKPHVKHKDKLISIQYAYFTMCIFAASAANHQGLWFYGLSSLLVIWALWLIRPRETKLLWWMPLISSAIALGYIAQHPLNQLHDVVEMATAEWLVDFFQSEHDPYKTMTAIGHVGALKLSDRIIMRVEKNTPQTLLLKEASYNRVIDNTWFVRDRSFDLILKQANQSKWPLASASSPFYRATITRNFGTDRGMLALPTGTFTIENLPVLSLSRNQLGATKVTNAPDQVRYTAVYNPQQSTASQPTDIDLFLSHKQRAYLSKIANQLQLTEQTPQQKINTIKRFFANHFRYSLYQSKRQQQDQALENFLFNDRYGHCEYFASATTLLLRQAGIAARYTVGYSVQEYSTLEKRYIVRARHAHAWTQAFVDGYWQDIDTTPAIWYTVETNTASIWQPVTDVLSWLINRWVEQRNDSTQDSILNYLWLGLLAALAWSIWRITSRHHIKRIIRVTRQQHSQRPLTNPTHASSFQLIITQLSKAGYPKLGHEPLTTWLNRLETTLGSEAAIDQLRPLLAQHYRLRFDPAGLTPIQQQNLEHSVQQWLLKNSIH